MACNLSEGLGDDILEQILAVPPSAYANTEGSAMPPMVLQLVSGSSAAAIAGAGLRESLGIGMGMPLGLNLEQGFLGQDGSRVRYADDVVDGDNVANHHLHLNNSNNATATSSSSTSGISCRIGNQCTGHRACFQLWDRCIFGRWCHPRHLLPPNSAIVSHFIANHKIRGLLLLGLNHLPSAQGCEQEEGKPRIAIVLLNGCSVKELQIE